MTTSRVATYRRKEKFMKKDYINLHLHMFDGGAAGGFDEKLSAARACGAEAIVIRRPKDVGESMEEILHFVRKRL